MRTTIDLDADVAQALQRIRRERNLGVSEAVNELVRRGLAAPPPRARFAQQTRELGVRIDVSNVAEAVELIEGPRAG